MGMESESENVVGMDVVWGAREFLLQTPVSRVTRAKMTNRKVARIPSAAMRQIETLQSDLHALTGVKPTLSSLIERCVLDGVETLRKRPALAVDTSPRKGDR